MVPFFTPADTEYLFQRVRQYAFEREYQKGKDYGVTTQTFLDTIFKVEASLTDEIVKEFEQDCSRFTRY